MKRLFALAVFLPGAAFAQAITQIVPQTGSGGDTAVTVGTSSAQAIGAAIRYSVLSFKNESASASIAVCKAPCTAALNTAGNYTISAGQMLTLSSPNYIPGDAFNAIASAVSTPLTVQSK